MTRPLKNFAEIAVIGGGLAGLSAARHAARLGKMVTLFEGSGLFGGLVSTIGHVEGLPVHGEFSGQDLAIPLLEEARKVAVQIVESGVAKIELGDRLTLTDEAGTIYRPEAIIIASGRPLRKLNVPGEEEYYGMGVSRCATCDGGFFRKQDVVVVGGGDGAVHEALTLAQTSKKVTMICRSPLKAQREYIDKIASRENVTFLWDSEVAEILGNEDGVSGVRVRNVKDGTTTDVECAGLFPFIGVTPNTGFLPSSLLTKSGYVKAGANFTTSDPRIFAIGAVRAGYGGNLAQAMSEGIGAAQAAVQVPALAS